MKKIGLFLLTLLLSVTAAAADYSVYFQQKLPGGVPGFRSIIIDEPTSNAFYLYNLANHQPEQFTFDSTIICNTTTHVCSVPTTVGPAGPNGIDGATGPAGAKGDKGDPGVNSWAAIPDKPTTFAPSPHTTSLLTDMTAAGRAIATATDAAAMRVLLDVPNNAALSAKFNTPAGSTAQYVRGDGSLATFPAPGTGTVTSVTAGAGLSGGTITSSGTISMPNTGTAGTYSAVTTDSQGRVTSGSNRSQSSATRSLNSVFQVSATRDAMVFYSVQMTVTASIASGQDADLFLDIASDSGFTLNVQTISVSPCSQVYTLAVALQGVQKCPLNVSGFIPAAYYARLRTANNTGAPAFLYRAGQEVLQ